MTATEPAEPVSEKADEPKPCEFCGGTGWEFASLPASTPCWKGCRPDHPTEKQPDLCAECGQPESSHKECSGCEVCGFEGDGSCTHPYRPADHNEQALDMSTPSGDSIDTLESRAGDIFRMDGNFTSSEWREYTNRIIAFAQQEIDRDRKTRDLSAYEAGKRAGVAESQAENERLEELINHPFIGEFFEGVKIEAAHQTKKWGAEIEETKYPHEYALVLDKLKGKQALAIWDKDTEKFKHHLITMAAVCFNVFRQIDKEGTAMNRWFEVDAAVQEG